MALTLLISLGSPPSASAWISKNTTTNGGESSFYVQTYNVPGEGPTDSLRTSTSSAKTLTAACSEGFFEIVFYEMTFPDGSFLYMGKRSSATITIDNSKPQSISVKEKSVGNVISVVDPKSLYKKIAKSKSVSITYKVGGTNWVGKFKTSGLSGFASGFSRYGCTV